MIFNGWTAFLHHSAEKADRGHVGPAVIESPEF